MYDSTEIPASYLCSFLISRNFMYYLTLIHLLRLMIVNYHILP